MKTLLVSFIFSFILLSDNSGLKIEKDKISLSIDKNTTQEQIATYKQALLKRNINLGIEKVIYDKDQKIKYIKIAVDCNDGFKGSSGETLLNDKIKIGFYRIYNTNGSPFGMSPLTQE